MIFWPKNCQDADKKCQDIEEAPVAMEGAFRLPSLPPGPYTVVAELQGFKTVRGGDVIGRENVIVRLGMIVKINIEMEPAAIEEEVVVTAPQWKT